MTDIMKMKKTGLILTALLMSVLIITFKWKKMQVSGMSEDISKAAETPAELTICVASDIHYIAPELTDGGAYFTELIENADGKAMQYCEEITDAFVGLYLKSVYDDGFSDDTRIGSLWE